MSETSSESDMEFDNTPPEITSANNINENQLPQKSKHEYEKYYALLRDWQQKKKIDSFSENVLIAFFSDLLKKWKSSTLWKIYSILKATINVKHDIDISRYKKLKTLLKGSSEKYVAKKSKVFTEENVKQFLENAPDEIYLATKVALVIGILGACRKTELYNIKISNIKDLGSSILIAIPNTNTNKPREFTITGDFYNIVKKYWALRPCNVHSDNFFINFQKNKCTRQVIGINKLGNMPKQIATFLNLDNPKEYTGHCFRRTSATTLVNSSADISTLKRHGSWKSSQEAEEYTGCNSEPAANRSFTSADSVKDMKMFCRLCLNPTNKIQMVCLGDFHDLNYPYRTVQFKKNKILQTDTHLQMIRLLMPNFNHELVYNPVMCQRCSAKLQMASEFVEQCMASQKRIQQYKDSYCPSQGMVSCEDVFQNKSRIPPTNPSVPDASQNVKKRKIVKPSPPILVKQQQPSESHNDFTDVPELVSIKMEAFDEFEYEDKFEVTSNDISNIKQEIEESSSIVITNDGVMRTPTKDVIKNELLDYNIETSGVNSTDSSLRVNVPGRNKLSQIGISTMPGEFYHNVPAKQLVTETFVSSHSPMSTSSVSTINYQHNQNR